MRALAWHQSTSATLCSHLKIPFQKTSSESIRWLFFVVTFNSQNVSSLLNQYEEETKKMREQIDELRTTPRIFQSRNCHACTVQASDGLIFILMTDILGGSGLDMPSVHFFCNHSFHQVFPI
jgi:hypothetical protein